MFPQPNDIYHTLNMFPLLYRDQLGAGRKEEMKRLSKSGIEYLDYQWGIFSGCQNQEAGICPVTACWAKKIVARSPGNYPNGFEPTIHLEALDSPKSLKNPSRVGVGWVGDVIGYGLEYKQRIFDTIQECKDHTFLFLTKNSLNLKSWSRFPKNCWVGVSSTGDFEMTAYALGNLWSVDASVKFISFEPLLQRVDVADLSRKLVKSDIGWVIVGAQTNPTVKPEWEWVKEIIEVADQARIPVFLKDNLGLERLNEAGAMPYYKKHDTGTMQLRQEYPL